MKLVYIKWQDASGSDRWFTPKEAKKWFEAENFIVEQVGWVYEDNNKYIGIVGRKIDTKVGMLQKIPKTWIIKRVYLDY